MLELLVTKWDGVIDGVTVQYSENNQKNGIFYGWSIIKDRTSYGNYKKSERLDQQEVEELFNKEIKELIKKLYDK